MRRNLLMLSSYSLFLYSLLFFNICVAAETADQDVSNIIGTIIEYNELFQKSRLPKRYHGIEHQFVIKHIIGKKGEPIDQLVFDLLHVKSSKEHYLWLVCNRKVIDVIKVSLNNNQKIKVGDSKDHDLKYNGFKNPIFALINKSDYSVIKAWSTNIKEGKIQEIPLKGIYCYSDDCIMEPQNEHSSKEKCFGVSGWPLGKDCPNIELSWEEKWDSEEKESDNIYFINSSGSVFKLPGGMAIFSPNCKFFWHTSYYHKPEEIKVFSTKTGQSIIKISGEYPAWSSDGDSIYFFRTKKSSRQLWKLNVENKKQNLIIEVHDYLPCLQQGDEAEWYPVIVTKEGYILWNYWVKDPETKGYTNSAKKLTIDAKGKEVIKIEHKESCPCSAFEKRN